MADEPKNDTEKAPRTRAASRPADEATAPTGEPQSATTDREVREDVAAQAETTRTALNPYPAYEQMGTDELRAEADSQGVGVPADVEKSLLIGALRKAPAVTESGPGDVVEVGGAGDALPALDLMTVNDLRALADENDVTIDEETERGYLITQLRANTSGATAAQSATLGTAAPADSQAGTAGGTESAKVVSDKDANRTR